MLWVLSWITICCKSCRSINSKHYLIVILNIADRLEFPWRTILEMESHFDIMCQEREIRY